MRKRIVRSIAAAVLALAMAYRLSACSASPDVNSILSDGAADFGEGKQEGDFALISSDEIMNRLIDDFQVRTVYRRENRFRMTMQMRFWTVRILIR